MTLQADTLVCDTVRVAFWQSNPAYDYNRELITPEIDVFGWLSMQLSKLLRAIFGSRFAEEYSSIILVVIAILILLLILWFVYKKRPELFMRSRRGPVNYSVHEDTIYGVDFDSEIKRAMERKDYRESIRLLYLQTLKLLSDEGRIDWQPYKTPTEYICEVKQEALRSSFRRLTNGFLRVRYGNFAASEPLFEELLSLQTEIRKGGIE